MFSNEFIMFSIVVGVVGYVGVIVLDKFTKKGK